MSRRLPRRGLTALASATLLLAVLPAAPAAAATTTFTAGVLTVTGTAADDVINIDCSAGLVVAPSTPAVSCSAVTSIVLSGQGGDDDLRLWAIEPAEYTGLDRATVNGGGGHDEMRGWAGRTDIIGGAGDDGYVVPTGPGSFNGGAGSDGITSGCDCDQVLTDTKLTQTGLGPIKLIAVEGAGLNGGGGANEIDAHAWTHGPVFIYAQDGNDVLVGTRFSDRFAPANGADEIVAGKGDDLILAEENPESVSYTDDFAGGPGKDRLEIPNADSNVYLSDTSVSVGGSDQISSIDDVYIERNVGGTINAATFTGSTTLVGAAGPDTITGGSGPDRIHEMDGFDTLTGGAGIDTFFGRAGFGTTLLTNTFYDAALGDDTLSGFERADLTQMGNGGTYDVDAFTGPIRITDQTTSDDVIGNGQTTYARSVTGGATIVTGPGDGFTLSGIGGGTSVTMTGVAGLDLTLTSGPAFSDFTAFTGKMTVHGSAEADSIYTGRGRDALFGGDGADMMKAGRGNDRLRGDGGNDSLNGSGGKDRCVGGPGKDKYTSCE